MKTQNYFLCSKSVVDIMKPTEVSKPFKSGYEWEDDEYFIAILDFKKVNEEYKEDDPMFKDFWCRECSSGSMDVSKITLSGMKKTGVFVEIEWKIGLTTERNIAMTILELSKKFNCTPIELINKVTKR